jgi:hypothetical protein
LVEAPRSEGSTKEAALTQAFTRISSFINPILFAVFPLLSLFAQNETELELRVLWSPLVVCVIATAALYGVFLLIVKRGTKAGALASLVVVAFFYFGIFSGKLFGLTGGWFLALWLGLSIVGVVALLKSRRALDNLTLILTAGAVVLTLPVVAKIAIYQANHPAIAISDPRLWPALRKPAPPSGAPLPDIYYIVPDDYARPDVLKRYFRYDDGGFIRQLQKRGFVFAKGSRSPYSDSESNIAAPLNLDYLNGLPRILGKSSQDVRPVKRLIQDNRAAQLLKPLGYRYIHLDTDEVTFAGGNPHISPLATPDSFTNLWLQKTVLRQFGGPLGFDDGAANERFRDSIRSTFSDLAAVPHEPGPKFVVFHTLLPHDPYIFGAQGQSVNFPGQSEDDLGSRLGMRYYLKQVKYMNRKLLEATDAILAQSKAPPVIVIQSDEGFQANPETFGEAAMQDIRVKGLSAFYMPGLGRVKVPQDLNTVNSLRFLFNQYFGTHYKLLKNFSYPELDLPYEFQPMHVR